MFLLSARTCLCHGETTVHRCSCLTCFLNRFVPLKQAEHSGSGHKKGASVSAFSHIHGQVEVDSQSTFQFGRLATRALSPSPDSKKKTVSHTGHTLEIVIVVTYSFSTCVPFKLWACTSCAALALCVSTNFLHLSPSFVQHLHRYILWVSSAKASSRSCLVPG